MTLTTTTDPTPLTIDLDGELIPVDESMMDFSDMTHTEVQFIHESFGGNLLDNDGEPPAIVVAAFIMLKLARGRNWSKAQIEAVLEVLVAWLTDNLEEVN